MTQAQVQVNLIGCIQSAIKAKCPIVGIPIPGQRPFTVRRDKLVGALRGMQIIDAAIQLPLDHGHAQMVVYGVAPRVRGTYKFYLANGHQTSEIMREGTPTSEVAGATRQARQGHRTAGKTACQNGNTATATLRSAIRA